jgi:dUTP pyrophosphatase
MVVKVKKLENEAKIPEYAHEGDAGMDFFALEKVTISPGQKALIRTGICIEIPHGYVGLFWDKSSIGIKNGIKVLGGVIDSGYRGEVQIGMINLSQEDYTFEKGHKVSQMIIQKVESPTIAHVEALDDSHRGIGGFGSSGK